MAEHARDGQSRGVGARASPADAPPGPPGPDRRIAQAAPESAVLARLALLQLTAGNAAAARLLTAQEAHADGTS